ncbi:sporulation integral membrane protein YlbJ [Paenibacillus sp. alder61]|uniref:Sporulation integral membrane protein YlbJ n=1 Tax=Paenibacillus faecis TaxID=862114 RepID=A0A5D0CZS4_9BACL|nr:MULTISPECIES: sporulation integral membrane protein YlbJ [Paenibacillus]MCA1293894.1 sporulation integral membrane protein YlbJ [Paenibacillus sp. alder61]TYA15471.1 sporulation integral membrane protein YlbJ [Paenibacillus faecis]
MSLKRWSAPLLLFMAFILAIMMVSYPRASWEAGVRGLAIWWDVLFPSLFPFFVISELMLGFGIVHFLGKLLDPLMRPLFRIPGSGGFVAAMGFASGYPVSAKLATKLREQRLVSRVEGERLVSFTTSSDPIFLIGAVSIGFFGDPKLAGLLAAAHYGSALMVGLLMRFYGAREGAHPTDATTTSGIAAQPAAVNRFSLPAALRAMHEARLQDGRSLGELLRQAVASSLQLMTVVGGLVVFFSVILEVLTVSDVMSAFYAGVRALLPVTGLPVELAEPLVGGLFEVTLGAKAAASPEGVPSMFKAAAAAFILSWGGLSVHAQVASILNGADLRYLPFLVARLIHAVLAAILAILFWKPLMGTAPVLLPLAIAGGSGLSGWSSLRDSLLIAAVILTSLIIISLLTAWLRRIPPGTGAKKGK